MIYNIECVKNVSTKPMYTTMFQWNETLIELIYNYNDDVCNVKINHKSWEKGKNIELDTLVEGLSNSMTGLEFEECYVGEKFSVNTKYM